MNDYSTANVVPIIQQTIAHHNAYLQRLLVVVFEQSNTEKTKSLTYATVIGSFSAGK